MKEKEIELRDRSFLLALRRRAETRRVGTFSALIDALVAVAIPREHSPVGAIIVSERRRDRLSSQHR